MRVLRKWCLAMYKEMSRGGKMRAKTGFWES
ncbi:MAG: hypothetical protein H6Q73_2698 [Firmicutes bacterium]|nr:hypothetical protein [Bacillota bacterium]